MKTICKLKGNIIDSKLKKSEHCFYLKLLKIQDKNGKNFYLNSNFKSDKFCDGGNGLKEENLKEENYFLVNSLNNEILNFSDSKFPESYIDLTPTSVDISQIGDCKLSKGYNYYLAIIFLIILVLLIGIIIFKKLKKSR